MLDKIPSNHNNGSWRRGGPFHAGRAGRPPVVLATALTALLGGSLAAAAPTPAASPPEPPEVVIHTPTSGAHVSYGAANAVHFSATAYGPSGSPCCTIKWSSNVDGPLGSGKTLDYAFATPGKRIVTATAQTSPVLAGGESVTVFVDNDPPTVSVVKPSAALSLYRNDTYKFEGTSWDKNLVSGGMFPLGGELPCSSLKWSSVNLATSLPGPSATGCKPLMSFPLAGTFTVRLSAVDSYGAAAPTATRTVVVGDKPANSAPSVTLTHPDDGAFLYSGTTYALAAVGNDVDGDPITYNWTMKHLGTTKTIGVGAQISWKPANYGYFCDDLVTLTVTATDNDGSDSDSIVTDVNPGPCF